ncbi:polar amino acid ABC transporter permease [Lampropedia cohaerens]|uniref:Polar amino acid ABC transporter permease n=1 Tax=Lampropedia cohaerens TaxID=1610491 RepID=A0A0U1Q217_9BURK|nr:amino acid ABC transporter permease [Lampropedia cohaerens]KKW68796.1 polar amino acid ABC transporter permease [Lampropedia cohaerens]
MNNIIQTFFNVDVLKEVTPYVLNGLWTTLALSLWVIPLGLASGLLLAVAGFVTKSRLVRGALVVYIDFFRAFPPLVLLIFLYTGLPYLGVELSPLGCVAVGFMLNNSSYFGEIFRAGLESVPPGQREAARSTGMSRLQSLIWVEIPQALRNVFPDLVSNMIEVVKLTTIASVVSVPDMLYAARTAQSMLYNPTPIVLAAAIYLALLWPLVIFLSHLEKRRHTATRPGF